MRGLKAPLSADPRGRSCLRAEPAPWSLRDRDRSPQLPPAPHRLSYPRSHHVSAEHADLLRRCPGMAQRNSAHQRARRPPRGAARAARSGDRRRAAGGRLWRSGTRRSAPESTQRHRRPYARALPVPHPSPGPHHRVRLTARGSFRYRAGLSASSRSRTAAFSAGRSVEWTLRAVAAVMPSCFSNAVNTVSRWPMCSSASSTVPGCGMRQPSPHLSCPSRSFLSRAMQSGARIRRRQTAGTVLRGCGRPEPWKSAANRADPPAPPRCAAGRVGGAAGRTTWPIAGSAASRCGW